MPGDAVALADELLARLRAQADPTSVADMARYGIGTAGALGVGIPVLRGIERELRTLRRSDPALVHAAAARLWASRVHEARMLAGFLDVPPAMRPPSQPASASWPRIPTPPAAQPDGWRATRCASCAATRCATASPSP